MGRLRDVLRDEQVGIRGVGWVPAAAAACQLQVRPVGTKGGVPWDAAYCGDVICNSAVPSAPIMHDPTRAGAGRRPRGAAGRDLWHRRGAGRRWCKRATGQRRGGRAAVHGTGRRCAGESRGVYACGRGSFPAVCQPWLAGLQKELGTTVGRVAQGEVRRLKPSKRRECLKVLKSNKGGTGTTLPSSLSTFA